MRDFHDEGQPCDWHPERIVEVDLRISQVVLEAVVDDPNKLCVRIVARQPPMPNFVLRTVPFEDAKVLDEEARPKHDDTER